MRSLAERGIRASQFAILTNTSLALVKLIAGLLGNSYALVADAIESMMDIVSSLIVWGGLRLSGRDPDEKYPFGYGRAEPLAGLVVALLFLGAGFGVAVEAVSEIREPHHAPAAWTLVVLVLVVLTKTLLSRRVHQVGEAIDSTAVRADAWHHLSDAITSAAAFVGISIALVGGPGWEVADDWAAMVAAAIIVFNATVIARPALDDLMDRTPDPKLLQEITGVAERVEGVIATEKLTVRKTGLVYRVTIHVQADANLPLHDAHVLSGKVKTAIRAAFPKVESVLVHMEPYEPAR